MAIKGHKKGNKVYLAEYKSKRVNGKVVMIRKDRWMIKTIILMHNSDWGNR